VQVFTNQLVKHSVFTKNEMSDKNLVQEIIQHNNHQAFEELVNRYKKMVITTGMGFLSNYHDAEDIAQDVFIELYKSLPEFRNESKLSTWIYRITVNKSLNFLRRRKRETIISSFWGDKRKENGESKFNIHLIDEPINSNLETREQHRLLRNAINKLPDNQRIALILSTYQELSYKEIAEVMEVSLSAVESLLFRAKSNLRKVMVKQK